VTDKQGVLAVRFTDIFKTIFKSSSLCHFNIIAVFSLIVGEFRRKGFAE